MGGGAENFKGDIFMNKLICLSEEANVATKYVFRKQLLDAIRKNNKNAFKECVEQIGKDWHVIRSVETVFRSKFIDYMWRNKGKILSGTYKWHKSKYNAYSYESKICFLINPLHYKLIYDSNNAEALKNRYGYIDRSQWQKTVDRYYLEELKFSPKDETDIDCIFRKDYRCWAADKEKTWLCIENNHITYKRGRTEKEALAQEPLSV